MSSSLVEDSISEGGDGRNLDDFEKQQISEWNLVFSEVKLVKTENEGLEGEDRTTDVQSDCASFSALMVHADVVQQLSRFGFTKPSPIQTEAIPLGLLGQDLLVQAKTGTGKTLVFVVLAVQRLVEMVIRPRRPLIMVVCPTHEIAQQNFETIKRICNRDFFCELFIGGSRSIDDDRTILFKGIQIAVGTPGRIAQLIKLRALDVRGVELFVLDEADKLMEESFVRDVDFIISKLPSTRQMCVLSATYPGNLDETLCAYMVEPALVRLCDDHLQLKGVRQFAVVQNSNMGQAKEMMLKLLKNVAYTKCLVFCNNSNQCLELCEFLRHNEINATHITGAMEQVERAKVMKDVKNHKIRVIISTDLYSRGVDIQYMNLVVNMQCPYNLNVYLHRIGRAGRYGTKGVAVTILHGAGFVRKFKDIIRKGMLNVKCLALDQEYPSNLAGTEAEKFFKESLDFSEFELPSNKTSESGKESENDDEEKETKMDKSKAEEKDKQRVPISEEKMVDLMGNTTATYDEDQGDNTLPPPSYPHMTIDEDGFYCPDSTPLASPRQRELKLASKRKEMRDAEEDGEEQLRQKLLLDQKDLLDEGEESPADEDFKCEDPTPSLSDFSSDNESEEDSADEDELKEREAHSTKKDQNGQQKKQKMTITRPRPPVSKNSKSFEEREKLIAGVSALGISSSSDEDEQEEEEKGESDDSEDDDDSYCSVRSTVEKEDEVNQGANITNAIKTYAVQNKNTVGAVSIVNEGGIAISDKKLAPTPSEELELERIVKLADKLLPPEMLMKISTPPAVVPSVHLTTTTTAEQQVGKQQELNDQPQEKPNDKLPQAEEEQRSDADTVVKYDRESLWEIRETRNADEWMAYLWNNHNQKWLINETPFELDADLRCPFNMQLRVQRDRESERRRWAAAARQNQPRQEQEKKAKQCSVGTTIIEEKGKAKVQQKVGRSGKEEQQQDQGGDIEKKGNKQGQKKIEAEKKMLNVGEEVVQDEGKEGTTDASGQQAKTKAASLQEMLFAMAAPTMEMMNAPVAAQPTARPMMRGSFGAVPRWAFGMNTGGTKPPPVGPEQNEMMQQSGNAEDIITDGHKQNQPQFPLDSETFQRIWFHYLDTLNAKLDKVLQSVEANKKH